jgi:hypothetical protein
MDLVKKQSSLASAKVTALVRLCGNTFALRRKDNQLLEIRLVSRAKAAKK